MTVDGEQDCVGGHRAEIVEQHPHAHAPVGRPEQMLQQDLAAISLFQMKYCTSRLRCAASARASRAARAPSPIGEFMETGLPGCAATRGPLPPPAR
jgi:hypothetical protein